MKISSHHLPRLFRKKEHKPTWNTILDGPAKSCKIFVPARQPIFQQMIEARYDPYFWEYITVSDLESQTVLDIGGHIGYHSMCFSKMCGAGGRVHVFEPNPANLERMRMNFKENPEVASIIRTHRVALSDFNGTTVFNMSDNVDNQTSTGGYIEGSYKPLPDAVYRNARFKTVHVDVMTLDSFVQREKIVSVKLLKIDVEGAELAVLEGARHTIATYNPIILAEVHSVSAMFHVSRILHSLDYDAAILDDDGVNRCFIAARHKEERGQVAIAG